jgi:hypothetical protein
MNHHLTNSSLVPLVRATLNLWISIQRVSRLDFSHTLIHKMRKTKGHIMNPTDASRIVELAATIWPNVKDTTHTREAWFLALSKTNLYDALDAVGELARVRKTVHVSDVVKRAAQVRDRLLRSLPPIPTPPVELADDPAAETLWMKTARERQLYAARLERHAIAV